MKRSTASVINYFILSTNRFPGVDTFPSSLAAEVSLWVRILAPEPPELVSIAPVLKFLLLSESIVL